MIQSDEIRRELIRQEYFLLVFLLCFCCLPLLERSAALPSPFV